MNMNDWKQPYKETLKDTALFEIKSKIGRLVKNKEPDLDKANFLNLGCGLSHYNDFINADFFCGFAFWRKEKFKPDWQIDLRYPLNCKSNTWYGVYTEHVLEHLYRDDVISLLKELHRTMRKGAVMRVIVPDAEQTAIDYINKKYDNPDEAGVRLIWHLAQNWGHKSVWDFELMREALMYCGFKNVKKRSFMSGSDERLLKDSPHRRKRSLYVEAEK